MDNLSKIAQGIFLGNGEVWNFLDYAVNRNCGGLLYKTQQLGLLDKNFAKNFNGGHKRKYSYEGKDTDNIPTFNAYSINPTTGKIFSTDLARNTANSSYPIHGGGGNLGDLYTVPEEEKSKNSDLKFITKESFTALGEEIRKKSLSNNVLRQPYKDTVAESYAGQISDKWKEVGLKESGLGDEIKLWGEDDVKRSKYSLEEFASSAWLKQELINIDIQDKKGAFIHNEDTYRYFSVDHPIHYHNITAKVLERTFERLKRIDEAAKEKQNTVRSYQSASQRFIDLASKNVVLRDNVTFNRLLFEYTTEGTEIPSIPTVKNYGLYDYYNDERLKYKSALKGIKNPWGRESWWNNEDSYGIEFNERGQEYYSINEENKYEGEVPISSKFNGGGHFVQTVSGRSHSFYQEAENGNVPTELKTSVSDGSSVLLSNYSGSSTSRLLAKTNQLFMDAKINSLINRFHTDAKDIDSELITAADPTYGLSRGRNLLKEKYEKDTTGYDNPYCRVWTAHHQYSKLKDRIRPFIDDKNGEFKTIGDTQSKYGHLRTPGGKTNLDSYSVLRSDGFVRITPTHIDGKIFNEPVKNYMFSIENLAWRDVTSDINNKSLSPEQRGPNGGRIMWFPPYNLKFSENVNVNWNANTFIGRGEEIYTYTNTVRTGTLDFTLLIDHPSILNKWRGTGPIDDKEEKERDLLRFFAGCGNINDAVEPANPTKEGEDTKAGERSNVNPKPTYYTKKIAYVVFFPNNFSGYDYLKKGQKLDDAIAELRNYNNNASSEKRDKDFASQLVKDYNKVSEGLTPKTFDIEIKQTLFAGADDIDEIHYFDDLENIGTQITGDKIFGYRSQNCKVLNIEVKGFASSHGNDELNKNLCDRRRTLVEEIIKEKAPYLETEWSKKEGIIIKVSDIGNMQYVNAKEAKLARAAYAIVNIQWKEDNKTGDDRLSDDVTKTLNGVSVSGYSNRESSGSTKASNIQTSKEVLDEEYTYDNEYLYFSEVMDDELVHKHIVDKVRFFDPAFHSITPEGFNARLTFLHQCTRQGPTNAVSSGRVKVDDGDNYLTFAGNLAFGRAPYCILRIGDFFHTKICIDSMSITYDNNGVQWDLNPEGVGVQPMYANVSLSFKFLGGQDLVKPIERLQNAVTANYYANASVYSRQADTNKYYYDAFEGEPKIKTNK